MNASTFRRQAREGRLALLRSAATGFAFCACVSALIALAPLTASAQTCDAPLPLPLSPARPTIGANTCGGGEPARNICVEDIAIGPSVVFSLTVEAGNTAFLSSAGTGISPYFYLTGPGCNTGACIQAPGFLSLRDVAPGDYLLVVTSSPFDAGAACGVVSLLLEGDLAPSDVIFHGDFD